MAHKILGIDLGAWSVKVAELEAGFRQAQLIGLYEKRLLAAEEGESGCQDRCDERRKEPVPAGVVRRPYLRLANGE